MSSPSTRDRLTHHRGEDPGIAALAGSTEIRVLHEDDGGLPRPQSDRRRTFYRQPQPTLFDEPGQIQRIRHLVVLWGHQGGRLVLRLVAPRNDQAVGDPIWAFEYEHPLARSIADFSNVTRIDGPDDVDEVALLADPMDEAEDTTDSAAEIELIEPPHANEDGDAEGTEG